MNHEVLVFRTNIHGESDANRICRELNQLELVKLCNVALDDCDRVLRVESLGISVSSVIGYVNQLGFACEELPD
ncbi:MAG: hypothetical protein U0Y10_00045 [Spirosomataceae bacterium]